MVPCRRTVLSSRAIRIITIIIDIEFCVAHFFLILIEIAEKTLFICIKKRQIFRLFEFQNIFFCRTVRRKTRIALTKGNRTGA